MILSKVVFQTDSSTVPTHQKSVLIRTSSQVTGVACHASRAVPLATSRKGKLNGSGPIVDYELRQTTMRWAGFESREGPAWRTRGETEIIIETAGNRRNQSTKRRNHHGIKTDA